MKTHVEITPDWHNLLTNPKDLPEMNEPVIVVTRNEVFRDDERYEIAHLIHVETERFDCMAWADIHNIFAKNVIAWKTMS